MGWEWLELKRSTCGQRNNVYTLPSMLQKLDRLGRFSSLASAFIATNPKTQQIKNMGDCCDSQNRAEMRACPLTLL